MSEVFGKCFLIIGGYFGMLVSLKAKETFLWYLKIWIVVCTVHERLTMAKDLTIGVTILIE